MATEQDTGVFTVRFPPRAGESISSLRHRVGLENGHSSFPRFMRRQHPIDPDLIGTDAEEAQLAHALGLSVEVVRRCSLASLRGTLLQSLQLNHQPVWLLKSHYSQTKKSSGPVFCAECLRTDRTPYFRLSWRVGLITECLKHGVELIDKCPRCGHGVWPHHAQRRELFRNRYLRLDTCPVCGGRLFEATPAVIDSSTGAEVQKMLDAGQMILSPQLIVPSAEILAALDAFCSLFIRRVPRERIGRSDSEWAALAQRIAREPWQKNATSFPIPVRRELVKAAWGFLDKWPDSFLAFAEVAKITQFHFSAARYRTPQWVDEVVSKHLSVQVRNVSTADVRATIESLRRSGVTKVTKTVVQRAMGCQAGAIQHLLSRRFDATSTELDHVLEQMANSVGDDRERRVVPFYCARDHAVFCAAVLTRCSFRQAAALSFAQLKELDSRTSSDASSRDTPLAKLLAESLSEYRRLSEAVGLFTEDGPLYVPRGGRPHGPAQRRMTRAMSALDLRLARYVSVFWNARAGKADA